MKTLMAIVMSSVVVAGLACSARAAQQKTVQATIQSVGDRVPAPAIALSDAAGTVHRLSDYRGKPLVVNLWATDCGGCKVELPEFVKASQRFKGAATVVGVSLDIMYEDLKSAAEGWARVKPFAASHGLTYPILLDDGSAEKAFKVTAMPATYLIDRDGRIAASYIGIVDADNLETNIQALLAER